MFARSKRLSRAAFPAVLKKRRLVSPNFSAVCSLEDIGIAIVVSKKVAPLSVVRHRIKRRVTGALQTLSVPHALILFPKAGVNTMKYQDIRDELTTLLSKIKN